MIQHYIWRWNTCIEQFNKWMEMEMSPTAEHTRPLVLGRKQTEHIVNIQGGKPAQYPGNGSTITDHQRPPLQPNTAVHSSQTQPCCVHLFFSCLSCSAVESDLLCRGEKSGCKHSLLQICCVWLRPVFNLHGFEAGWGFLTLWDRNKKKKNCQRGQRDLSVWKRAWRSRLAPSICCSERI